MVEATSRRRLAAILAADASGYSRLMASDEPGTVAALDCARAVFGEHIGGHQGRVIDMAGDSVLAVFETAAGAVSAALAVQEELTARAAAQHETCRMRFRIGVHLGDVIEKSDGTVYGDGVNTAARLESLADPGGVCVSEAVECALRHRLQVRFEDLGQQSLKNLPQPVRAFRVAASVSGPAPAAAPHAAVAGSAGVAPKPAFAGEGRSHKPAIAVLPFDNMSGEAEQEFFTDGITEDIITELSRFRELFVISRNSSFKYKGQKVDVAKFARELGVQYVVEGSVRKAGNRVRVTVQLIDAETDRHVWAERYDRELEDIFAIQDEVTTAIVATLPGRVEAASRDRAARKPTENMVAYELVLAGKLLHHRSNRDDNLRAQEMLERAIALDPNYAHAHAWRACVIGQRWGYNWCEDRAVLQPMVVAELQTALALDENDSDVHRIFAAVNLIYGNFEQCLYHQQRALALNPNDDLIVVQQGEILTWCGRAEEGLPWIRKAMQLNPYHPERFWGHLARAYFGTGKFTEALDAARRITTPDAVLTSFLCACHARLGDAPAAQAKLAELRARWPAFTLADVVATLHYRHAADRELHLEALALAGLRD